MVGLQDCMNELLLKIYLHLHSIDDAIHFARCTKRLFAVFDTKRLQIMKNIVLNSSIHTHDIALCHFQDAYHEFPTEQLPGSFGHMPVELRPLPLRFEQCLHANSLSDRQVWDVVARWQGLKSLQHLYLDPKINRRYMESSCLTGDNEPPEMEAVDILQLFRNDKKHEDPSTEVPTTIVFSPSEKGRFYKALTGYWLAIESRKFAELCCYPRLSIQNEIWDKVATMWQEKKDLQDSLDVLEVHDFVYGFLCRHIGGTDVESFTDWVDEGWLFKNETLKREWAYFTRAVWLFLSPPDILELFHLTSLSKKHPNSVQAWSQEMKRDYLRRRGFFGPWHDARMINDVGESADRWFSNEHLEMSCGLQLQKWVKNHSVEAAAVWTKYRTTLWQTNCRGRFSQISCTKLLDFVTSEIEDSN
ncbi:hypothetical protein BS50DRAFT_593413 [Corynespora cassiicola Philippines]|uniref:F-box domain-containing protein n=1 Tax=Corynespora cassiicola Philippines TaxID=1448308 RepID=A0A2T2N6L0_CORCC|nr:hypothetical protein BS50DRAFT_593413 [Corynespora cassiicola Philippines]